MDTIQRVRELANERNLTLSKLAELCNLPQSMGKDISFKNHDRFIHLGIAIAALRKMRGMSQEQLAEKAGISRSLISAIEAPGLAKSFSLDVFFNLADALDIDPADLINATVFPDRIFKQK